MNHRTTTHSHPRNYYIKVFIISHDGLLCERLSNFKSKPTVRRKYKIRKRKRKLLVLYLPLPNTSYHSLMRSTIICMHGEAVQKFSNYRPNWIVSSHWIFVFLSRYMWEWGEWRDQCKTLEWSLISKYFIFKKIIIIKEYRWVENIH